MSTSETLATAAAAGFFVTALLMGVVKYVQMSRSPDGQAHFYVDTAHRAALMYSFACLLLMHFARLSRFPEWLDLIGVAGPVAFFAFAVLSYIVHGLRRDTENQIRGGGPAVHVFMVALIASELGGFLILVAGWAL
ncbi:MAG: hypothetical protein PVI30_23220 [Myxococcales bacterium]|jgi:hypothetical protein